LRDQCGAEVDRRGDRRAAVPDKKTFRPCSPENEGIPRVRSKTVRGTGLILLCDGEVARLGGPDEHNRSDILTWGFEPHSRLPGVRSSGRGSLSPDTVAQPSPIRTGFPDLWLCDGGHASTGFKEPLASYASAPPLPRLILRARPLGRPGRDRAARSSGGIRTPSSGRASLPAGGQRTVRAAEPRPPH
jgi:hypothetical protein